MEVSILLARRAAEGAEAAPYKADIGEVDVSIDDVGDHLTNAFAPDAIGGKNQRFQVSAAGLCKQQSFVKAKFVTRAGVEAEV